MTQYTFTQKMIIRKSPAGKNPCFDYAALELQRLLGRLGIHSSIRTAGMSEVSWGLTLATTETLPPFATPAEIKYDGFTLKISSKGIAIAAREPKGVLNGVYELAERIGFLFLMPGEAGEWEPDLEGKLPQLSQETVKLNPRFPHRGVFGGSEVPPFSVDEWFRFFAKLKFNASSQNEGDEQIAAETGIRLEVGLHGMAELLPRELFATRPELFRMFQPEDFSGKRVSDSNFCCNHPESKRIVQESYRKKIKKMKGIYAFHTWADDLPAGGWCMCSLCRSYTATEQSMIVMRHLSEVIEQERLPMRVPVLAYHDTMFPGSQVPAPREGFLLFAPRERCYAHALDDESCAKNRFYLTALQDWVAKFAGIDDAHTFEYYFDQLLFRGLHPFIPDVIIGDMAAYERVGIQTHLSLQVGGPATAPEFNMLVFARAHWDSALTADGFINQISAQFSPKISKVTQTWKTYLQKRRSLYSTAMRLCEYPNDIYFDYRWLPETTHSFGAKMAKDYERVAKTLDAIAAKLQSHVGISWPQRVKTLAEREAARAHFEGSDLRVMSSQQDGVNKIAHYIATGSLKNLSEGLDALRSGLVRLEISWEKAQEAGLSESAYYHDLNKRWLRQEFAAKIKTYESAFSP